MSVNQISPSAILNICGHTDGYRGFRDIKLDGIACRERYCEDCGIAANERPRVIETRSNVDLRPALARSHRLP